MRFVVIGAGAVGGAFGGRLAERGHRVVLVARGANHTALRRSGLVLALPDRVVSVRPDVATVEDDLELNRGDVLLLTVKSQDAEPLIRWAAALPVGQGTAGETLPIVCCQNGLANETTALRYFAHVHGASLMLPVTHLDPGRVDAHGWPHTGVLRIGRFPGGVDQVDVMLASVLEDAGFACVAEPDIMAWKRAKLLLNLGNAVQVLCGDELVETQAHAARQLIAAAREEASRCFTAAGLAVAEAGGGLQGLEIRSVAGRPRQGNSTWQSLARGTGSVETDFLNGEIVLFGRLLGIATPANDLLQRKMRQMQRGLPAVQERIEPRALLLELSPLEGVD